MTDKYVSLDPTQQDRYLSSQKNDLIRRRQTALAGEPFGSQAGAPFAVATGLMAYHLLSGQFSFFPLSVKKAPHYGIILGATFLGFHFGRSIAAGVFNDPNARVSSEGKRQYLSGTGPLDKMTK
uniref:Uncharacterized protein n=1 Tax=Euplotes crassus TaxID=5936 RepID=A0A7S3KBW9_EUPCR|mmetsp:Transcript_17870/g.17599  ORF Transcript_17870/g.17599 Transcript_17870/m.17599 type:complete len:124 (+) Transcript_17870:13-384(+)